MFGISNEPGVLPSEEDHVADVDEPPESKQDEITELPKEQSYIKSRGPAPMLRRESLLTQALSGSKPVADTLQSSPSQREYPRALSAASSQSIPSTVDLTSDSDLTSPARSASPSPPLPATTLNQIVPNAKLDGPHRVTIAPVSKDDKPDVVVDVGEAAVEKSLGRKRCIMFACSDQPAEPAVEKVVPPKQETKAEPEPRKCRLTFVCPTRQDSDVSLASHKASNRSSRQPSPTRTLSRTSTSEELVSPENSGAMPLPVIQENVAVVSPPTFHEFASSQDETDAWIDNPDPTKPKLTLSDCMKKENAIRRIAQEAEEEADAEAREREELDDDIDEDQDVEDDFAPSDDDDSDGNESDDENGFAESDDESDDDSEYQFWAPTSTTAATSMNELTHFSSRQRSRASSVDSGRSSSLTRSALKPLRRKASKPIRMRPSTPELPDSTDFVCGTLDEDRPLEAAFISCRELRKKEKHVLIPQDIDPSFPTSDPEDEEDDDEEDYVQESSGPTWMRNQFEDSEDGSRGRRSSAIRVTATQPTGIAKVDAIAAKTKKPHLRSPPPPKHRSPPPPRHRSPPPRRLFGRSPHRRSSPHTKSRLRSPRGSPNHVKEPLGLTINRLAQRPSTDKTASLPHTPNPFFRNWKRGSPATSVIPSAAVTPNTDSDDIRADLHVRGPVDIVIGLEKKRQKRKEKFWRQHCRKAAREQAEKKPIPGRGVERMKELGLECAERTRGYGLGQPAQLVLSL